MSRTLRDKATRNAVWAASGGRCQRCGCELPEDWHADHVVPWSAGGDTNIYNIQALCPGCNLRKGNSVNWQQFFSFAPDFASRSGQSKMYAVAAEADLSNQDRFFAELVTGYGKTLVAYGFFWILHKRGLADRMLVLVPRDEQRVQFCDDILKARNMLGANIRRACAIEKILSREFRWASDGSHQIFVATYQQLNGDSYFKQLMSEGRWLVVADECHHLSEDGKWGQRLRQLDREATLYLSATPIRSDMKELADVPAVADAVVPYKVAYEEHAVRRVRGYIEHYYLSIQTDEGARKVTTEDLKGDGVVDFQGYEAKRQLRYNTAYLDWMLLNPLRHLVERNVRHPGQHQMLVFAMSCRHADHICQQLNALSKQLDYSVSAEWVGVGEGMDGRVKGAKENADVIARFRNRTLPILVQVDKAGEGFDVKTASILVFLHLVNADGKLLQQIGRGIRRNFAIPFEDDDCIVYASADTNIADVVRTMEQQAEEVDEKVGKEPEDRSDRECPLFDIPALTLIDASHDRTEHVAPDGVFAQPTAEDSAFAERFGVPLEEVMRHYDRRTYRPAQPAQKQELSDREQLVRAQEQVKAATTTLCGNILRILKSKGKEFDAKLPGVVKRKINGQWNYVGQRQHESMGIEDFKAKHAWLQEENHKVIERRAVPLWFAL